MKESKKTDAKQSRFTVVVFVILIIFMGLNTGMNMDIWYTLLFRPGVTVIERSARIPNSILPGPERHEQVKFELDETNSVVLQGRNDPEFERWSDILGNYYSSPFVRKFNYEGKGENAPQIRFRYEKKGATLTGRLEAKNLKPNFAYQLKLLGDFRHREAFEKIGKVGRWRLPGIETNYTYENFLKASDEVKEKSESYVFFDFFVTDDKGNAVRNFNLDSSLHVLWKERQRKKGVLPTDTVAFTIKADNPDTYARPKKESTQIHLWCEREKIQYPRGDEKILLPTGTYQAFLILTEESFHSSDNDGGWWATVAKSPVEFEIVDKGN